MKTIVIYGDGFLDVIAKYTRSNAKEFIEGFYKHLGQIISVRELSEVVGMLSNYKRPVTIEALAEKIKPKPQQSIKLKSRHRIKIVYPSDVWCNDCGLRYRILWQFESNIGQVELCHDCKEKAFKRSFGNDRPDDDAFNHRMRGGSFSGN